MESKEEQATNKLKIYLIKAGYDVASVLKEPNAPSLHQTAIPNVGTLYYKDSHMQTPAWLSEFFLNHDAIQLDAFKVANTQAVLLIELKVGNAVRIFAIPFGMGRHLIKELSIENRFGLITTLNVLEASAIRSVGKRTISSNPKISLEQISRASGTEDFQINIEDSQVKQIQQRIQFLVTNNGIKSNKVDSTIFNASLLTVIRLMSTNNLQLFMQCPGIAKICELLLHGKERSEGVNGQNFNLAVGPNGVTSKIERSSVDPSTDAWTSDVDGGMDDLDEEDEQED